MAVPSTPAAPTLDVRGPDYIRAAWADTAANPAITSWQFRWRKADQTPPDAWQMVTGIDEARRSATATDLDPGAEYEIQIRAVNGDGNSQWSPSAEIETQETDDMAVLQSDFTELQAAKEATAGAAKAAVVKVPYNDASVVPRITRKTLEEKGTVLADTADVVVQRACELNITEELNTETILMALACGIADATPANRKWTFTPSVTNPSGLATANWQWSATDGSSGVYDGQTTFARPIRIAIEASSETAQLTTEWMGRAKQSLAAATNIAAPSRWIIPAQAFSVYIDDTWAGLGTTKWAEVRSFSLDIETGLEQAMALAGRADLDAEYWRRNRLRGSLSIVCDHDDTATGELGHWEAGDLRYVRLSASNGLAGANLRAIQLDFVGRYIESPDVLAMDGGQMTLDLALALRADSSNNIFRVVVDSGITAI